MKSIFGMRNTEEEKDMVSKKHIDSDIDTDMLSERDIDSDMNMNMDMDIKNNHDEFENNTLRLRQEELDITKNRIQSGEVILRKDIIEEKKIVDVPVMHEEVIIERRAISNDVTDSPITDEEIIRIPVSREEIEVGKHTVITGEVSAHKHQIENVHHVEENIKREEARIDSEGDADVVDNGINSIH